VDGRGARLEWSRFPTRAFDAQAGIYGRWFPDGALNTCHNALDRHVAAGHGARVALIHDSAMTGTVQRLSYAEMLDQTARLAGALAARGVAKGDRVILYMPMVPEAAIAMLACARLGAIHSVVFGGFAAAELAARIADATPRAVITASCGLEPGRTVAYKPLLDAALALSTHQPDLPWCCDAPRRRPPSPPAAISTMPRRWPAPCRIPASRCWRATRSTSSTPSGRPGKPKGIVRDNGGHAVALHRSMPP
jgi:propionyl-CoA synthetase